MDNQAGQPGLWKRWIMISMKAAALFLMFLLFVIYFTLVLPIGIVYRLFADPLRVAPKPAPDGSFFVPRRRESETRESAILPY